MRYEIHFREIRDECGLTQADACEVLDRTEGFLSKLENGKVLTTLPPVLIRLARLYNCHPWDFLTFRHFPPPRLLREWRCAACGSTTSTPAQVAN